MLTQCSRQLYVSRRNSFRKILRHQQHQVVSSPGAAHVEHGAQVPDLLLVYLGQDDNRKRLREALGRFAGSGRAVCPLRPCNLAMLYLEFYPIDLQRSTGRGSSPHAPSPLPFESYV